MIIFTNKKMNKLISEQAISNNSQYNHLEMPFFFSQKGKERQVESIKGDFQNENPLSIKGNIKFYCRILPNKTINSSLDKFKIKNNNKDLLVDFTTEEENKNPSKQHLTKFNFSEIFWTSSINQEIFNTVCKENIEQLFTKHINALILVYGITNFGKTYTINGNADSPGILQLSLANIFKEFQILKTNIF